MFLKFLPASSYLVWPESQWMGKVMTEIGVKYDDLCECGRYTFKFLYAALLVLGPIPSYECYISLIKGYMWSNLFDIASNNSCDLNTIKFQYNTIVPAWTTKLQLQSLHAFVPSLIAFVMPVGTQWKYADFFVYQIRWAVLCNFNYHQQ